MPRSDNPARLPLNNRFAAHLIESLLGLKPLAALYDRWREKQAAGDGDSRPMGERFLDHTLASLDARINLVHPERLGDIPRDGAVIYVANHPFGGIEGMQLAQCLLAHRPDLKVLTNEILTLIPEFSDLFIGVDVLSPNSAQKNVAGMKKVTGHLKRGGALLMFPAGTVASLEPLKRRIVEKPWTPMLGRLARRYQASCQALYVEGRNSIGFYLLGLVHKRLRTAMLARELNNKRGRETTVVVGSVITPPEIGTFGDDRALTDFLRLNCEAMQLKNRANTTCYEELQIAEECARPRQLLRAHLDQLQDCRLISKSDFSVYCVPFARMGPLMPELALVREQTFRAAGEGTGRTRDSDVYDPHYLHLFVWDDDAGKLVGAYRMGCCDRIIAEHGVKGLYSRSLFTYKRRYIERLGGAVEVGRSFVSRDYQRNPRALDMLWRGIGTFIAQNPQYHTLFGCVSISSEHSLMARAFLSETMLTRFAAEPEFLTDIQPRSPLKVKGKLWSLRMLEALSDIAVINKLVGHFDHGKSIPVLLRHYLALNGRFVSFSVNHGFNQALDGLILVDLRNSPVKYLNRYLGQAGTRHFLARWQREGAGDLKPDEVAA